MNEFVAAANDSRARFLAGQRTPEEERHCRNVGRVAVDFAGLEEDLGQFLVALETGSRGDADDYMKHVRDSGSIRKLFKRIAALDDKHPLDAVQLKSDYFRFKAERDRYAHASVGSTLIHESGRRMIELKTSQHKHPKGADHPLGVFSDLPTDAAADELCREMRQTRQNLEDATNSINMKTLGERLWSRIADQQREVSLGVAQLVNNSIRSAAQNALGNLGNAEDRKDDRPEAPA